MDLEFYFAMNFSWELQVKNKSPKKVVFSNKDAKSVL